MKSASCLNIFGLLLTVALTSLSIDVSAQSVEQNGKQRTQKGEMAGYLLVPNERVPETYNAGFSMYVAAWPLLDQYPGSRFQTGLFGTWMFAQKEVEPPIKLYSDIEGGLGWWRDTRFATETPKFIMGGVAPNFTEWANGPGAGKGRDWDQPKGKYGVAQLSPWLLWPPDGVNLKQGTSGELFGYGYLPLPLTDAKSTTNGKNVPTGDQSWTLFLNTQNFKGPVAFFTPNFWSQGTVDEPRFSGLLLDSRPSSPNRALQMETQHVPSVQAVDAKGETYARIAPTYFPCSPDGESLVVHQITSYNKTALWDSVKRWFSGGEKATGAIRTDGAELHRFTGKGGATWRIYADGVPKEERAALAWSSFATPMAADPHIFGYQWDSKYVKQTDTANGRLVKLPEWFHLVKTEGKPQWIPVNAEDVPTETGLANASFDRPQGKPADAYVTPENADSSWKTPGPVAGPFETVLGDGSVVTYSWYRFADQPALLNADMTDEEREAVQARVEMLHRDWTKDREYLPPPAMGQLAELDPALIVTPPHGMEVGYVPIVTRQAAKKPLQVFILAGQSNMEGAGQIKANPKRNGGQGSLEYLVKDPATAARFAPLVDASGEWRVRDDVTISYLDRKGPLTIGFGSRPETIGPELGFGWVMGDAIDEPVLLIKCAWGGKSLAVDFRPPSAGKLPYSLGDKTDAALEADPTVVGKYYRETLSLTKAALSNLKDLVPGSDGRYEIVGFGWHQGWNDRINDQFNAEYESNMTHFIHDMRKELKTPALPFVIAETGMTGPEETHPRALSLMKAQAAVAERPEFKGNVAFVSTKNFWRPAEQSPSNQGYHWNSNAETYYLIGEAMGEAMKQLLKNM